MHRKALLGFIHASFFPIIAVSAYAQTPPAVQAAGNQLPDLSQGIAEARTALNQCVVTEATSLAKTSQEGAQILAEVTVYRCVQKLNDQRRFGDQDEAHMVAADAIIKARIAR